MSSDDQLLVRVGAVVLVLLAAAAALLLILEGRHVRPGIRVEVDMARIGALQPGADVRLAGLTLGSVDDILLIPAEGGRAEARLSVWLDRRHAHLVRETTDFFVNQEGLLGEAYLGIAERGGEPGRPLADGARVRGVAPPEIDKLLGASYRNLQAATQLLRDGMPEIDELRGALAELQRTMDGLEPVAPAWRAGQRLVDEARRLQAGSSPRALAAATSGAADLAVSGRRRLAPLAARLDRLAVEARRLGARGADPRLQRLAAALTDGSVLVERARQALEVARALQALVEGGAGTLGAFLGDVELADEMKELTRTLKRQPWLTIGRP